MAGKPLELRLPDTLPALPPRAASALHELLAAVVENNGHDDNEVA